jgi:hypothetical protein
MDHLLYHAISYEHLLPALRDNRLVGGSTHRMHRNGTVPWPLPGGRPTPTYLQSEWYFGICLTRDPRFAFSWNDVVLVLDQESLRQRHRLVPYNWMEHHHKAEAEEFLVTHGPLCTCEQGFSLHDENGDLNPFKRILVDETRGQVPNLSRHLRKICVWPLGHKWKKPSFRLRPEQLADLDRYRTKEFLEAKPWIEDYCERHRVELEVGPVCQLPEVLAEAA